MNRKSLSILAVAAALFSTAPADLSAEPGNYGSGRDSGSWHGDYDRDHDRGGRHDDHWSRTGSVSIRNSRSRSALIELRDTYGRVRSRTHLSPGEREYLSASARSGWTITVRSYGRVQRYSLNSIGDWSRGRWYVRI
jgi:hypothetical protein